MTSHLNSHRTTDIKLEMLSGVQTGNGTPHDEIYAALPMLVGLPNGEGIFLVRFDSPVGLGKAIYLGFVS